MPSHIKKPERIRDRLWIWAHEAGSYGDSFGLPGKSRMTPAEAALYLGVPNLIMVRYNGRPTPPYGQLAISFRPLQQVVWSIVGAHGESEDSDRADVVSLAARFHNISGVMMDDFFQSPEQGKIAPAFTSDQLGDLRQHLTGIGRRLDLWVVIYTHQLCETVVPYLELCDLLTFWTWRAEDLTNLESNFATFDRLLPGRRKVLGCYMWDFGANRPMPVKAMEQQCELGRAWLHAGRIEGLIFLASPICDLELEAVEWTRRWIADVGDEEIDRRWHS